MAPEVAHLLASGRFRGRAKQVARGANVHDDGDVTGGAHELRINNQLMDSSSSSHSRWHLQSLSAAPSAQGQLGGAAESACQIEVIRGALINLGRANLARLSITGRLERPAQPVRSYLGRRPTGGEFDGCPRPLIWARVANSTQQATYFLRKWPAAFLGRARVCASRANR